jgi:hypothetical protein
VEGVLAVKIVIPSRGRPAAAQQITSNHLRDADLPHTIVRSMDDETVYPEHLDQLRVHSRNISEKRAQILLKYGVGGVMAGDDGKFLMIDDDIHCRRVHENGTTTRCTASEWRDVVAFTESLLDTFAMVSMADRFMIQDKARPYEMCTRARVWIGWNTRLLPESRSEWPIYDRVSTLQDVDVQFQLFRMGFPTATLTSYCFEAAKSWGDGGCSHYRTPELSVTNHEKLRDLWPRYVTLRPGRLGGVKSVVQFQKAAKELMNEAARRKR